jgi:hypothetical protein
MSKAAIAPVPDGINLRVVRELITVERANELWQRRAPNRSVAPGAVDRLASDMTAGRWELNAETIKISSDGRLVDGQHRIAACIKSGMPFHTFVAYGVDRYAEVDICRTRGVSDALIIFDERKLGPRASISADGALGHVLSYAKQTVGMRSKLNLSHSSRVNIIRYNPYMASAIPRFVADFISEGGPGKIQANPLRPSVALAILLICEIGGQDVEIITTFLRAIRDGIGLSEGEPAAAYRNMLISSAMRRRFVPGREAFRLALNAAIAHLAGKKLQIMRSSSALFPGAHPKKVLQALGLEEEGEDIK